MGHALMRVAVAAALAAGVAPAFAAADPPAPAARIKAETRYCILRHKAGAATTERFCKTRSQWIRQDGVDPARHR
jgi:hypothetical protein